MGVKGYVVTHSSLLSQSFILMWGSQHPSSEYRVVELYGKQHTQFSKDHKRTLAQIRPEKISLHTQLFILRMWRYDHASAFPL